MKKSIKCEALNLPRQLFQSVKWNHEKKTFLQHTVQSHWHRQLLINKLHLDEHFNICSSPAINFLESSVTNFPHNFRIVYQAITCCLISMKIQIPTTRINRNIWQLFVKIFSLTGVVLSAIDKTTQTRLENTSNLRQWILFLWRNLYSCHCFKFRKRKKAHDFMVIQQSIQALSDC